jgi:integrase
MALEKTATKGVYKERGKKGRISYVLMYYIQVSDPLSEKGWKWKPKGKRFSKYQDAVDFKVKTQSEVKGGTHIEPSDLTVEEIAKQWLASGKPDWKTQTYNGHQMQVVKYIIPSLCSFKVSRLSAAAIRAASVEWLKTLSPKTVNKLFATISRICEFAINEHDAIRLNPMKKVKRLKNRIAPEDLEALAIGEIPDRGHDAPEAKPGTLRAIRPDEVFTAPELKKIIEASLPGLERAFIMTAMLTGLRHGELCAIRWSVIELKRGTLSVNRSLTQIKSGPILERPKTPNAYRKLELAPELVAELRRWKLQCPPNPNEFIFVNARGKPTGRKQNNAMLHQCCERAGVKPLSLNNLRHAFASQHLIAGTPLLEVSKMMGHSKPTVTLEVYSHWAAGEKSSSQPRLASRIFAAGEEEIAATAEAEGQKY